MIETKRLKLYPANQEQMRSFIASQTNDVLKSAYKEMLDNSLKFPDFWEWYAIWMIELKNGTHIGEFCFKGLNSKGIAEIGYGILEEFQNKGYATEAVKAALNWAFQNKKVTAIEAETEVTNLSSLRVLEKCGFVANGIIGEEGPRFEYYPFK